MIFDHSSRVLYITFFLVEIDGGFHGKWITSKESPKKVVEAAMDRKQLGLP